VYSSEYSNWVDLMINVSGIKESVLIPYSFYDFEMQKKHLEKKACLAVQNIVSSVGKIFVSYVIHM
jgi:hypothetical protein